MDSATRTARGSALLAQLVVRYANGQTEVDRDRRSVEGVDRPDPHVGHLRRRDVRRAARESAGWSRPGYDDRSWRGVRLVDGVGADARRAGRTAGAAHARRSSPSRILSTPDGQTVFDLGQNMVGWVRLRVSGPAGTTIRVRHAEVLDKDGQLLHGESARRRADRAATRSRAAASRSSSRISPSRASATSPSKDSRARRRSTRSPAIVIHSDLAPTGHVRDVERAREPAAAEHHVGAARQLPRRAHRLSAARRAARLDRRRAGVRAHRGVQHGRRPGSSRSGSATSRRTRIRTARCRGSFPTCSARGKPGDAAQAGWADAAVIVPWTMYLAYGDTSVLERAVSEHARVGRVQRAARGRRLHLDQATPLRRLARVPDDARRLSRRDDGQGSHRDGVLRALDRPARAQPADVLGKTEDAREVSRARSRRSGRRSSAST